MTDAAFEEWIARAKASDILDAASRLGATLRKAGSSEWSGPCPACGGRDRFSVSARKGVFLCRGGGKGDVISMVQHVLSCEFVAACEFINQEPPPRGQSRVIDPSIVKERKEERRDREGRERRREMQERQEKIDGAAALWAKGQPIIGTHAEAYLKNRYVHITDEKAIDLRFVPSLDYMGFADAGSDEQVVLGSYPCMIAAVRNVAGDVVAVHRTYLDGRLASKLRPPGDVTRNAAKKAFGRPSGGMIRLGYLGPVLAIGEGIETTLAWDALPDRGGSDDISLAAAYSLGNLAGQPTAYVPHPTIEGRTIPSGEPDMTKPGVILPDVVKEVIILGDGDSDPHTTMGFILTAARRFRRLGRSVSVAMAAEGKDFNDELMDALR